MSTPTLHTTMMTLLWDALPDGEAANSITRMPDSAHTTLDSKEQSENDLGDLPLALRISHQTSKSGENSESEDDEYDDAPLANRLLQKKKTPTNVDQQKPSGNTFSCWGRLLRKPDRLIADITFNLVPYICTI